MCVKYIYLEPFKFSEISPLVLLHRLSKLSLSQVILKHTISLVLFSVTDFSNQYI